MQSSSLISAPPFEHSFTSEERDVRRLALLCVLCDMWRYFCRCMLAILSDIWASLWTRVSGEMTPSERLIQFYSGNLRIQPSNCPSEGVTIVDCAYASECFLKGHPLCVQWSLPTESPITVNDKQAPPLDQFFAEHLLKHPGDKKHMFLLIWKLLGMCGIEARPVWRDDSDPLFIEKQPEAWDIEEDKQRLARLSERPNDWELRLTNRERAQDVSSSGNYNAIYISRMLGCLPRIGEDTLAIRLMDIIEANYSKMLKFWRSYPHWKITFEQAIRRDM